MIAPPQGSPSSTDWDAILDELERALVDGSEFTPPADPGEMPTRVLARAEQLLERQRVVVEDLETERDRVASELDSHRRSAARVPNGSQPAGGTPLEL